MMRNKFSGVGVALVTPFKQNGDVDDERLQQLVEDVINGGVDYVVALGTTGESPTLSVAERHSIVQLVSKTIAGRVPLIMGIGSNNTAEVAHEVANVDIAGVDAVLSVAPAYNRPNQEGLYQHFKCIAEHSRLPIILYNIPGRTATCVEPDTLLRIAHDCKNVIGVKEASGNINKIMRIIKNKPEGFAVISGDDAITLPLLSVGIDGVISVIANAYPFKFSQMVHAAMNNDFQTARTLHYELLDIIQCCFKDGNPSGIKSVLSAQGRINNRLRLPLVPVNADVQHQIEELVKQINQ